MQGQPWCFHKSELDFCSSDADCDKCTAYNMILGTGAFISSLVFVYTLEYAVCHYISEPNVGICSAHMAVSLHHAIYIRRKNYYQ